jgi:hypothetical protein
MMLPIFMMLMKGMGMGVVDVLVWVEISSWYNGRKYGKITVTISYTFLTTITTYHKIICYILYHISPISHLQHNMITYITIKMR